MKTNFWRHGGRKQRQMGSQGGGGGGGLQLGLETEEAENIFHSQSFFNTK